MADSANNGKPRDRVGVLLYVIYILMLILSLVIFGRIIYIQVAFDPDPDLYRQLTPRNVTQRVEASRGNILSRDGKMLAMTYPVFDVTLDCTVAKDTLWNNNVGELAAGLSRILEKKSAAWYKNTLTAGRNGGNTHLQICKGVDLNTLNEIKALPILEKGRFKGGYIESRRNTRHYPYGNMGRRTIGFVRISDGKITNNHVGIEGKFDPQLSGKDGVLYLKMTDYGVVQNYDSTSVLPQDGLDVRTTLDIDFQAIVDRALNDGINEENELEGGCCVVMDVRTGAIRAMSNLLRNPKNHGKMEEISNLAIGRKGEPGSVFKTTNLMIMLENGHIKSLQETIPTNGGVLEGYRYEADEHIKDFEKDHGHRIPIIDGFKVSSNYMFRYLAVKYYEDKPGRYIDQLKKFHLGEAFDFDVDGLACPSLPDPDGRWWSKTDLTGAAIGYSVDETPLHILTFYNAIANKGRMVKPYLVEDFEKDGIVQEKRGSIVLSERICSRATADTITRALRAVIEDGTARRLNGAKCTVAGKTGTSRVALPQGGYFDKDGRKKNQGTFVGFFPAENPQYSIICVVYSYLTEKSFYGGTIPAAVVRRVVDEIHDIDPAWQESVQKNSDAPLMNSVTPEGTILPDGKAIAPDLSGLSLKDAIFVIENIGLRCTYKGTGHVKTQIPAAGDTLKAGETIRIELL